MPKNPIATKDEWLAARQKLLTKEKELTRLGDHLPDPQAWWPHHDRHDEAESTENRCN